MEEIFTYDLWGKMRRNTKMMDSISSAVARVAKLDQMASEGKVGMDDLRDAMAKLIPQCGWNYGMLVPFVFHRYPLDRPMTLLSRPFMFTMTCMAPNSVVTLRAGRQVGKCAHGTTTVETNYGPTTLEDIFNSAPPPA